MPPEAFFLPLGNGQRLCVFHPVAPEALRGLVLYIHPLAEEMNRARPMAALQSRALSRAGFAVLQLDLLGCGDSSGDFADASWSVWLDDVAAAAHWLHVHRSTLGYGPTQAPLWLWGLRCGCLLAAQAAARLTHACHLVFWQPSVSGAAELQQFLRLKLSMAMVGGQGPGRTEQLQQQLARDGTLEVAGYRLSTALAEGLAAARLRPPPGRGLGQHLIWLELSASGQGSLRPGTQTALAAWAQAGFTVVPQAVAGPTFWQTADPTLAPALLASTTAALTKLAGWQTLAPCGGGAA